MSDAILVTGASGFVGTHLGRALRSQGWRVLSHSTRDGDIATCRLDFAGVAHVFHLAGKSFVPDSWTSPPPFYQVNVVGTVNVLDFCRRHDVPLTFLSSYVYGRPRRLPIREDDPREPLNPYSHSKMLAEDAVRYFAGQFGVRTSIVRPFNIYGPGQDERFLIPTLIRQALDPGLDCITVRDARPKRDFVYISDLVSLLVSTVHAAGGGIYNAGSGRSVGIPDIVQAINAHLARPKALRSTAEARPEEVFDVVADISAARRDLGWEPRVAFDDGLRETIVALQTQVAGHQ